MSTTILTAMRRHWFLWLLVAYALYALAFVFRSSVVIDGQRYFLLLDDAMISMTYARNLAHGYGAVWYPGTEPVMGYSNPFWMLYMAMVHWLPLPPSMMALPIQLTGIALIGGTMFFVKTIAEYLGTESLARSGRSGGKVSAASEPPIAAPLMAVVLTAFYLPLNNWTLRGMEVGAVAFGASLAVWLALRCKTTRRCPWWLLFLLGLLTTVRMDAAIIGAIVLMWLVWALPERRGRILAAGVAWLALFVIGQMVVQKVYYHDWLPNTYYLKLAGIPLWRRVVWGLYVLFYFLVGLGLLLPTLAAIYTVAVRSKAVWLLAAVVVGQAGYSVYVGGDAWEWWGGANRYLCVAMPLFFVLAALGLVALIAKLTAAMPALGPRMALSLVFAPGLLILVQVNSYQFNVQNSLGQWLLLRPPPELYGYAEMIRLASVVREATSPKARVAVTWAGIIPYFSERQAVDLLGKNDRTIAKGPTVPMRRLPLISSKHRSCLTAGRATPSTIIATRSKSWHPTSSCSNGLGWKKSEIFCNGGMVTRRWGQRGFLSGRIHLK